MRGEPDVREAATLEEVRTAFGAAYVQRAAYALDHLHGDGPLRRAFAPSPQQMGRLLVGGRGEVEPDRLRLVHRRLCDGNPRPQFGQFAVVGRRRHGRHEGVTTGGGRGEVALGLAEAAPDAPLVHEHWGDNVFLETNFEVDISAALDAAEMKSGAARAAALNALAAQVDGDVKGAKDSARVKTMAGEIRRLAAASK